MSHLHKGRYTDKRQLIPYINGFLWSLEIMNEYVNHGQTYYVEDIDSTISPESAIIAHLQDENYIVSLSLVEDWKGLLKNVGKEFFEGSFNRLQHQLKNAGMEESKFGEVFCDTMDYELLLDKFIHLMDELIGEDYKFYEVFVDWNSGSFYECYQKDFLIENEKGRFFIHFGVSD